MKTAMKSIKEPITENEYKKKKKKTRLARIQNQYK